MQSREKQCKEDTLRSDLYHPWTPDVGQMLLGEWQVGCVMPRKVIKEEVPTTFAEWLKGQNFSWENEICVPDKVITENICSCGCYLWPATGTNYSIIKRGGTWFHDECGEPVSDLSKFTTWLRQTKTEQPEATRLRVPGEIITNREHICSCPICPCGCYTEARDGEMYFIEKRKGVFVHDFCGEPVE